MHCVRPDFGRANQSMLILDVTCLPMKLLSESGQQITLAHLPSSGISFLLLILGPPTFQIT